MKKEKSNQLTKVKSIILILLCLITSNNFAQQLDTLRLVSEPEFASGYVAWLPEQGVDHYKVNILQKDTNKVVSIIGTSTTNKQYAYIDPSIFSIGNIGYEIIGLSSSNSILFESGEVWAQVVGYIGAEKICEKTCIGNTYAWNLTCYAEITSQYLDNGELMNNLGNHYLYLSPAFQYYNNSTGDFNPYWQSVSNVAWTNLGNNDHPYTREFMNNQASDLDFHYGLYVEDDFNVNTTAGGPFFNADGYALDYGHLVQKKLDQFTGFSNKYTIPTASFTTCGFDMLGWMNFFNGYNDINMSSWPSSLTWFNLGFTPTGLECVDAIQPNGGEGATGGPSDWNAWYLALYEKVREAEESIQGGGDIRSWNEFIDLHKDLSNIGVGTGVTISGISISSLTQPGIKVSMKRNGDNFRLAESKGELTPGLYQMMLYVSDGTVVLAHYAIDFTLPEAKLSDFVEMTASPNPIENNTIKLSLNFSTDITGQLIVHDLSGNTLYSEAISENRGIYQRKISVTSNMVQLYVSLILADGSLSQLQLVNL